MIRSSRTTQWGAALVASAVGALFAVSCASQPPASVGSGAETGAAGAAKTEGASAQAAQTSNAAASGSAASGSAASAAGSASGAPQTAPAAPTAKPRPTSNPEVFACGEVMCRTGVETCCASGDEGVCIKSVPDNAPKGKTGYLAGQWEACGKVKFKRSSSFDFLGRCDESADCPGDEVCCEQFLFSGGTSSECSPRLKNGDSPCGYAELCVGGSACKLPGAVCDGKACVKPTPNIRCGDSACAGATPICCGDPIGCTSVEGCTSGVRIACATDNDCVKGQRCVNIGNSSQCLGFPPDPMNTNYVCQRDADCPKTCGQNRRTQERCVPSSVPWLKHCECTD